jgi:outer membrane lipoprotein carrier protein
MKLKRVAVWTILCMGAAFSPLCHADAVAQLKQFAASSQQAQAQFTQTVTSPDGKKVRKSAGSLAFSRPGKFRFEYKTPMPQLIVGDGQQVWLYDPDLQQVTVRPMSQAMGATPAALLSGQSLERDFVLKALPSSTASTAQGADAGIEWVEALPKVKEGSFQSVKVGFRAGQLVTLEVLDGFGQRSKLEFSAFNPANVSAQMFVFTPPAGVDVLR